MNKKTKKCGVFVALAAVLLLSAALVTTCVDQLDTSGLTVPQGKQIADFVPPPGKGYVMLNFGEAGSGRTVKPNTTALNALDKFGCFDVHFLGSNSANDEDYLAVAPEDVNGPFMLTADDTYSVTVIAYPAGNTTGNNVASAIAYGETGTGVTLTVTGGGGTSSPTIPLKEITTGTGTGTFKLNLSGAPSGTFTATLTVDTYPSGTPPINGVTVTSVLNSYENDTLSPGFYQVALTLSQTDKQTVTVREILHIYQGMTSTFGGTLPTLKTNVYTITFNPNQGAAYLPTGPSGVTYTAVGNTATTKVNHGDTIQTPTPPPTRANFDFVEWITTSTGTTAWNFSTKPLKNTELFAKWAPASGGGGAFLNVTIDWTNTGLPNIKVSDDADTDDTALTNFSFVHNTSKVLKFTVTNATSFTGTWDWFVDDNSVTFTPSNTAVFTLDISSFDYTLGPLTITASNTAPAESNGVIITIVEAP